MDGIQPVWSDQILAQLDGGAVVAFARAYLRKLFGDSSVSGSCVSADFLHLPPLLRVNITFRTFGSVRGSMSGNGDTLGDQLRDAVYRASRDTRFSGGIVKADLEQLSIEVWLQLSAESIPIEDRERGDIIWLGYDGIEIEKGSASAYYKPSVALTKQFTTPQDLFQALCKKASIPAEAWRQSDCQLRKTSWIHFCETSDRTVIRLDGLKTCTPFVLTESSMKEWASFGLRYLIENQYSDGSFCYRYRPFVNSAKRGETNPVRASGCAYAVATAASSPHLERDTEGKNCAERAVLEILRRQVPLERGGSYIADDMRGAAGGKLGTTALALLALLTPSLRMPYDREIDSLLTGIKSLQLDNGLFECSFGETKSAHTQIDFFPGQALLALVIRTEQGDESCRDYYQRAFASYRDHFRRSPATAFVGWHVDVWSRAALLDSSEDYAAFVFEQIDWMLQFQLRSNRAPKTLGGFSWNAKPPGYSSIVYTEALARGADLAKRLGDPRASRYKDAFQAGVQFCSRLRLTKFQSSFFPHPIRAIGGVATSLTNFEIRSDVVQHLITLALASLDRPALFSTAGAAVLH